MVSIERIYIGAFSTYSRLNRLFIAIQILQLHEVINVSSRSSDELLGLALPLLLYSTTTTFSSRPVANQDVSFPNSSYRLPQPQCSECFRAQQACCHNPTKVVSLVRFGVLFVLPPWSLTILCLF
jgi:hypothetical protein